MKQILVESCGECSKSIPMLLDIDEFKRGLFCLILQTKVSPDSIHPDCPLEDAKEEK